MAMRVSKMVGLQGKIPMEIWMITGDTWFIRENPIEMDDNWENPYLEIDDVTGDTSLFP